MKLIHLKKRAFTLIEILLVIGLISIASTAVYITYAKVSAGAFANKEMDFLLGAIDKIVAASTATDNFDQFTTVAAGTVNPNLLISGILPPDFIAGGMVNNNKKQNTWFIRSTIGAGPYNAISIVAGGYSPAECTSLIGKVQGRFDQISVAGGTTPGVAKAFGGPYDPVQTAVVCAGNNTTMTISFLYANKGTTM